jgi:hypothetical protein
VEEWEVVTDPPAAETWKQTIIIRGGLVWRRTGKKKDALFHFFDEAYRVAKPGAPFTVVWPSLQHRNAFGDPTHRRFIAPEVIHYLSVEGRARTGVPWYRAECNWVGTVSELVASLPKVEGGADHDVDILRRRCREYWNESDQTLMQLTAVKAAP